VSKSNESTAGLVEWRDDVSRSQRELLRLKGSRHRSCAIAVTSTKFDPDGSTALLPPQTRNGDPKKGRRKSRTIMSWGKPGAKRAEQARLKPQNDVPSGQLCASTGMDR
jgi:hypothetical protein